MLARPNLNRWLHVAIAAATLLPLSAAYAADDKKEEAPPEIEDKPDPKQPPVTAGGLYNLDTFPIREHDRTLTLTQGVLELKGILNIDLSEGNAFKTFTPVLIAKYGFTDVLQLEAGADLQLNSAEGSPKGTKDVYAAVEVALMYDLVDARVKVIIPIDPKVYFDASVGLPFKFRLNDKIAILGLEDLLIIHTADKDGLDGTDSPDLQLSVAGLYQVIDPLAVILRASLYVAEFKFSDKRKLPIDLDIQYSASNVFDVGVGVSLTNLAPPEGQGKATDSRAFRIFARLRI